jgi:spermidine synthase
VLKENLATGRYNLIYQDGSKFVETAPSEHYDGVIIDCTDTWTENSPSYVLTTVPFYKHIYRILKKGGSFSQMCSQPTFDGWFKDRWL